MNFLRPTAGVGWPSAGRPARVLATIAAVAMACSLPQCTDNENDKFPRVPDDGTQDGGDVPPPQPAQPHPNNSPQPKITECSTSIPSSGNSTCSVTKPGSLGFVLQGTILGPEEVFHKGEILFDLAGRIQCVGCDCADNSSYGQ